MESYEDIRKKYKPNHIRILTIAESPPPEADVDSSRHFYRTDQFRNNDRLFINTVRAIYEVDQKSNLDLEQQKEQWLNKLKSDGVYMIEALRDSLPHSTSKKERQSLIKNNIADLIKRIANLANPDTKIILIKSNVFDVAAEPLQKAGFNVLNKELVDYPGIYNQGAYRKKLKALL